jgi:hypothetical protein
MTILIAGMGLNENFRKLAEGLSVSSNSEGSRRFCETTAASCQNLCDAGISRCEKPLAEGVSDMLLST